MTVSMEDIIDVLAANGVDPNDQIYAYLSVTNLPRLGDLMRKLERVRAFHARTAKDRGRKANLVGRLFEQIVRLLLDGCKPLECLHNVRSTSSEIDMLVRLHPSANVLPFLSGIGGHLIGEAKCVLKGFKKEWVDELRGIMQVHGASRAVLFTAVPPKVLGRDARVAIALHAAQGHLIVPFGRTQIEQVLDGDNFLKLLGLQWTHSANHTTALQV